MEADGQILANIELYDQVRSCLVCHFGISAQFVRCDICNTVFTTQWADGDLLALCHTCRVAKTMVAMDHIRTYQNTAMPW
jgi:hypothetical protein